jgi:hypothetical protein
MLDLRNRIRDAQSWSFAGYSMGNPRKDQPLPDAMRTEGDAKWLWPLVT